MMTDKMKDELRKLAEVLYEAGASTNFGCTEEQVDLMKQKCDDYSPCKPICVVKDWVIWDVEPPKSAPSFKVSIVKADYIIYDELNRFPVGSWVRTSTILNIYEKCIFTTLNTNYILVGRGTRKSVKPKDIKAFF